jgi:hypothetical protein
MKFRFFIELFPFLDVLLKIPQLFHLLKTNAPIQSTVLPTSALSFEKAQTILSAAVCSSVCD